MGEEKNGRWQTMTNKELKGWKEWRGGDEEEQNGRQIETNGEGRKDKRGDREAEKEKQMVEERQRETQWEQKTWLSQRGTAGSNRKPKNVSGKEEEDEEGVDGERGNTAERDDDSLQKSALALQLWKSTDVIDVRLTLFSQQ